MSQQQPSTEVLEGVSPEEMMSALFAQLVLQQTNMALMLLGKVAHPESGKVHKDVEAARFFIDQLEMLEAKTKGNLTKEESGLLKQSLMNLRLAFVDAVETGGAQPEAASRPDTGASGSQPTPPEGAPTPAEEEHRKKFTKKY